MLAFEENVSLFVVRVGQSRGGLHTGIQAAGIPTLLGDMMSPNIMKRCRIACHCVAFTNDSMGTNVVRNRSWSSTYVTIRALGTIAAEEAAKGFQSYNG